MKIDVMRGPECEWDLLIDGKVMVSRESFAIVDGIREKLLRPSALDNSELSEVASQILARYEGEQ